MKKYEHVIILGIDGGGHFFREGNTPNFDRIFANGAVTYEALTSFPSSSGECWASMMTGVSPYLHGKTNDILRNEKLAQDFPYETIYRAVRKAWPEARMGAYCEWRPIIHGLVEEELQVDCLKMKDYELVDPICDYILDKKPNFLFTHFDSIDHEGHASGYGMPAYMEQVHVVDGYIGKVYEAVVKAGILEDTLFCVVCDHGGTVELKEDGSGYCGNHGGWTYNERCITFAATGKGVVPGAIGEMNIRDIAAIVRYAFDIPCPAFDINGWTAQIPHNLFEGVELPYEDISGEKNAAPRISRVQHYTELI